MVGVIKYLMRGAVHGSSQDWCIDERWYQVVVYPIDGPESPTPNWQPAPPAVQEVTEKSVSTHRTSGWRPAIGPFTTTAEIKS
jgi:hypothetical protein